MNVITIIMAAFSVLGAVDLIVGNKLGLGKEFEKGLKMFGTLALSMIGMIVLAPMIAHFLSPMLKNETFLKIVEPSVLVSSLFANDMGGASLALEFAATPELGYYNGLVVGSMMGATVSFTLPFVMQTVKKEHHKSMMFGLMFGICAIPVGCFFSGLIAKIRLLTLLWNLLPLFVFSAILAVGLLKFPKASVKIFRVFGKIIQIVVIIGLTIGILEYLLQEDFVPYTAPIQTGVEIVFNVAAIMTGAFPLVYTLSKLLDKPLKKLGGKVGVNEASALGFLSTLASSVTTFENMKDMDEKGVMLNSAFAVSAAFTIADHLAFTMSFHNSYVLCVTVGKLISGFVALGIAALILYRQSKKNKTALPPAPVLEE